MLQIRGAQKPVTTAFCRRFSLNVERRCPHPSLLSTATSRRLSGLTMRELEDRTVEFALDGELRRQILAGQRTRRLQYVSIKLDPPQIQALRKIATMKSIPYQTLIRQ